MHFAHKMFFSLTTLTLTLITNIGVAAAPSKGEQIYNTHCAMCHLTGVAGAPKIGDKAAWAPRLKQGAATLHQHALKGYKGMPAHGSCPAPTCSDADIDAAVDYMVLHSK